MSRVSELMRDVVSLEIVGGNSGDETFTHTVFGTFNVSRIRHHTRDRKRVWVSVRDDAMIRDRDIDEHRIAEIQPTYCEPILLIDCEDGTHILIDGTHRIVARRRAGYKDIAARIATLSEVQPFMIHIRAMKADGSYIDERELDRAFLETDQGRHNAPDGQPRPGSTNPDIILPGRKQP